MAELKASWAVGQVLACAGIRPDDTTERLEALAQYALDRCYYIDRASEYLLNLLDGAPPHG